MDKLTTFDQFANLIKIKTVLLKKLLYNITAGKAYISFDIPKKSGGYRTIHAPKKELKKIQKSIVFKILDHIRETEKDKHIKTNISHAFEKGKSIITNAKIHRNKKFILNIDLKDFFDSFHFGRVAGYFEKNRELKFSRETSILLAKIFCCDGKLPQGAPSSPIISNLICNIFDMRILKLAKKFKLDYTRYADDLSFSTNDKNFIKFYDDFMTKLNNEVKRAGFNINDKKTRLLYKDSRQEVTGLIVNKKISIKREYVKSTRAMANTLYSNGSFHINEKEATLNQLEGRFNFIDQIDRYNNKIQKVNKNNKLNSREKEYQKFLFYKYFYANNKPLILTEGKTDILYIKAALKNLYSDYPKLIEKVNNKFNFKISFLERSSRLEYFFGITKDGADSLKNIYNYYSGKDGKLNLLNFFEKKEIKSCKPVILFYDNELQKIDGKEKPLLKFINNAPKEDRDNFKKIIQKNLYNKLLGNLYLATIPIVDTNKQEAEIEDLLNKEVLEHKINNRSFSKDPKNGNEYGKNELSKYVFKNYSNINFQNFKKLLDTLQNIIEEYEIKI
ncbi:retron Ec67 family RNA-directed DNA polymerase/endonuclease [Campylobacter concisus]|uniref:retron Ec67 family RNA-directed DNA polymerase/endonuclease n=1 Tax=Campylobacter concisus TaxID=199 RepID=UPI001C5A9D1C|nr:retron Ec67 family RNA-directed DNA polymerase/endonuclease [Campylobacter concisus]